MKTLGGLSRLAHQLSMLEATVRCGSVGAAATDLEMSTRDVSRSLRELEAAMNTLLFARDRGPLRLTQAGEVLHAAMSAEFGDIRERADGRRPESWPANVALVRPEVWANTPK